MRVGGRGMQQGRGVQVTGCRRGKCQEWAVRPGLVELLHHCTTGVEACSCSGSCLRQTKRGQIGSCSDQLPKRFSQRKNFRKGKSRQQCFPSTQCHPTVKKNNSPAPQGALHLTLPGDIQSPHHVRALHRICNSSDVFYDLCKNYF